MTFKSNLIQSIYSLVLLLILITTSCTTKSINSEYNAKNFDSQLIEKLYSERVGVSPSLELMKLWDKSWDERKSYNIFSWGKFNVLYPDEILNETLNAPPNYHRVNLSNSYWFEKDKGRMSSMAYDSLVRLMDKDPLLLSQDVRKWYLTDQGKHLKIAYAIIIATPTNNSYSGRLFYGYDANKSLLGIYFYPKISTQWPIYMASSLDELDKMTNEKIDIITYIQNNSHKVISTNESTEEIINFYEMSYRKVFGDSLFVTEKNGNWEWKIFKNGKSFEVKTNDGYYNMFKTINIILNLNANHFRRPEFYSYCRLKNNYVAVLSQEQIIDFAKKGILINDFHTQPTEVFVPPNRRQTKTPTMEEFQQLDENSKKQFLKDFLE